MLIANQALSAPGCSLINRSYLPFFFLTLPLRFEADGREGIYCILGCFLPITYSKTISFHQRVSMIMIFSYLLKQSIMLSLPSNQSANHAILTFQPTPSIPFLQQYIISVPYLDAYSSICFPVVMARIREIMFFILFVFFLNGATRGKAQLSTLPKKGAAFFPQKMPVPPSGPSKQQNSVPRLRFIPAKAVYGSKRLVPSGENPLHH